MDFVPTNKSNTRSEAEHIVRPANNNRQSSMGNQAHKPSKMRKFIAAILIIIILGGGLGGGLLILNRMQVNDLAINKNEYQAVFLTNGQVYFGKLQTTNGDYLVLNKVYYLQVQQPVQDGTTTATTDQSQAQLVKLGNELHGPEDRMQISSKQVLFWENLKKDGKVAQSIAKYKG